VGRPSAFSIHHRELARLAERPVALAAMEHTTNGLYARLEDATMAGVKLGGTSSSRNADAPKLRFTFGRPLPREPMVHVASRRKNTGDGGDF
jgi:hypothetical protein